MEYQPKTSKWANTDVLDWIKAVLDDYHAEKIVYTEYEKLRAELASLPKTKNNYGLIHYDFESDNVFYDEVSKKCSAIDFDDGMYHWYAIDLEQVFSSMQEETSEDNFETAKTDFIKGYTSLLPISNETYQLLPLMRRFINLYSYARLIRSISQQFENEPEWMLGLRAKLNNKLLNIQSTFVD